MVTRVKVLDISERRLPSVRQALMREIVSILLSVPLSGYLVYVAVVGDVGT